MHQIKTCQILYTKMMEIKIYSEKDVAIIIDSGLHFKIINWKISNAALQNSLSNEVVFSFEERLGKSALERYKV